LPHRRARVLLPPVDVLARRIDRRAAARGRRVPGGALAGREVQTAVTTLDHLTTGVFSVDTELAIRSWNLFMASNSGLAPEQVIGRTLLGCFPALPEPWLRWKLRSVFLLGTFAFSSWKQRPYVFKFPHNRPLTGGIDFMYQDLAFLPVTGTGGEVA